MSKPFQSGVSGSPQSSRQPAPRQPLLWAALAFSTGILAGSHAWRPPLWWIAASAAFLMSAAYLLWKRTWIARGLALGMLFLLGALNIQMRGSANCPSPYILPFADGRELSITAHVIGEGNIRKAGVARPRQRVDVETEEIGSDDTTARVTAGVRLGIYAKEARQESETEAVIPRMRVLRLRRADQVYGQASSAAEFPQSGSIRL